MTWRAERVLYDPPTDLGSHPVVRALVSAVPPNSGPALNAVTTALRNSTIRTTFSRIIRFDLA